MKYKVSVIKLVTLVLMIGALAVAMVACSGAAGTTGPAGPPGEQGPPGETPDPTTPPTTDPPDPTPSPGAAPEVTMMFLDVYLSLDGNGDKNRSFTLREHFADIDSLLKYTVASSDAAIATAAVTDGVLKVTAIKDGNTTITVTAADDEGSMTAADDFSVTVAKTNAAPTTHGLSITDATALQKRLYYRDGARTHNNITVVSEAGAATGAVAVTDSILVDDFNVVIGDAKTGMPKVDDPADNKISVKVMKTGAHSYSIVITPDPAGFGDKTSQSVKIYPKDKFRAEVADPWEFTAMYNPPPKTLTDSFHLELKRDEDSDATTNDPVTVTAGASGAGAQANVGNVGRVILSDFFILKSLERMVEDPPAPIETNDFNGTTANVDGDLVAATPTNDPAVKIDKVTDTVCTVSQSSSSMGVVMSLNEAGAFLVDPDPDGDNTLEENEVDHKDVLVVSEVQALNAIRIDSRVSALGDDDVWTLTPTASDLAALSPEAYATYLKNKDTSAETTGNFTVTISCTDKDETATVTGTVVVRS